MRRLPAILLACAALAAPSRPAAAQERVVPAIDDSPSAELALEQAEAQARANPREAVRLWMQALDEGPQRLVRAGRDDDLFVTVATRVHRALGGDPALRDAFRREATPDAAASLAAGDLRRVFAARLDTEPGLEAALRIAEASIARGAFAAAACALARVDDHDLLTGRRAAFHARMTGSVRAALASAPRAAAGDPVSGVLDAPPAGPWIETWSVPIEPMGEPLLAPAPDAAQPAAPPTVPTAFPAVDAGHAFLDIEVAVRAFDLGSGRVAWSTFVGSAASGLVGGAFGTQAEPGIAVAVLGDEVIATSASSRGAAVVSAVGARMGELRWQSPIDAQDARAGAEPLLPAGVPLVVDGMAVIGARRTTARLETASWLVATDLDRPGEPAWSTLLASSGSVRMGQGRSADSPIASGGVIVVATATGAVAAVEPIDGSIRWLRRIPVLVREALATAGGAGSFAGPAVAGGRAFAITPDRAAVRAYDLRTGEVVADVPTGIDSPFGLPEYLVADDAGDTVLAVGDRIAAVDPRSPATARWTLRTGERPAAGRPRGRVGILRVPGGNAVVAVPESIDLAFHDVRDGREVGRIAGAGASNVVALGRQVIGAGAFRIRSWMPAGDAERSAREALARAPGADAAFPMLQLGRQMRSAALVAEAAPEALRRASSDGADPAAREDLWALMRSIDALDLGTGDDRARIDRWVDECARVASRPAEGALLRVDRQLRRRAAGEAARLAVQAALEAEPASTVVDGAVEASVLAAARRRVDAAAAIDPAATATAVDRAIEAALASAGDSGAARRRALLVGAMLCRDGAVGRRCVDAGSSDASARWVRAGREALVAVPATVARVAAGQGPSDAPAVKFSAVPVPSAAGVAHPAGALLARSEGFVELRKSPSFVPAWRIPLSMPSPLLVASGADLVVADVGPGGAGAVACITLDGALRWSVPGPELEDTDPDLRIAFDDERTPTVAPLAFVSGDIVVTASADGSATGRRRADGSVVWTRDPAEGRVLGIAHLGPALAILSEPPDDAGIAGAALSVIDASSGTMIRSEPVPGGDRVRWMKAGAGGVIVVGTEDGLRAVAPTVEAGLLWRIDAVDVQGAPRGWFAGRWLLVLDRFDELVAIDAWTGVPSATAFREPGTSPVSPDAVTSVLQGPGWVAVVHESHIGFFTESGEFLGRDAPVPGRAYLACAAAGGLALALDASAGEAAGVPLRHSMLLRVLDVSRGGAAACPPARLRTLGTPITSILVTEDFVALANGTSTQVVRSGP